LLAIPGWLLTGAGVIVGLGDPDRVVRPAVRAAAVGALLLALIGAVGLQALAPETAFVLAWPVLLGAVLAFLPARGALPAVAAVALGALGAGVDRRAAAPAVPQPGAAGARGAGRWRAADPAGALTRC
jgi:hypothetical protein